MYFFINKSKKYVFVHDFLSHHTSELPEILNLKYNEDRSFTLFKAIDFFIVFSFKKNENRSHFNT